MTIQDLIRMVRSSTDMPPDADAPIEEMVDVLLAPGALDEFVPVATAERSEWAIAVSAFAIVQALKPPQPEDVERLAGLTIDLATSIVDLGEHFPESGCLTAMKWLAEYDALNPRDADDQVSVLGLLWRSAHHLDPSVREGCLQVVTSSEYFGNLVATLGVDGFAEFQRRISTEVSAAKDPELIEDLREIGASVARCRRWQRVQRLRTLWVTIQTRWPTWPHRRTS